MNFYLLTEDKTGARLGEMRTGHGVVSTPVFMPVGTQATVKGLTPEDLHSLGAQIVLANTYHLWLRPGVNVIGAMGGLHRFMHWHGPLLTDSGGYQVFSLAQAREISEEGVAFQSHVDGSRYFLTPENAVHLQETLGADIIMCPTRALPGGGCRRPCRTCQPRTPPPCALCRSLGT